MSIGGVVALKQEHKRANRPGRPRSAEARQAILEATNEMLAESGFSRLTIEGIAARARVGKATIYRWWKSEGALATEAFLDAIEPVAPFPVSESAVSDLRAQLPQLAAAYAGRLGRVLREILAAAQTEPDVREQLLAGYIEPRRASVKELLRRGVAQGELRAEIDLDVVADALYGPLFHRLMSGHQPLSEAFALQVVEVVLNGVTLPPPPAG